MSFVVFTVKGVPHGKGRPRFRKTGTFITTYSDAKTKAYEEQIRVMARLAMGSAKPLEGPVSVDLYIRCPVPLSYSQKRLKACMHGSELPTKKPDIDNVIKAFLDAMNKVVYKDDTQVVKVSAKKSYSSMPGVDVCVVEI